MLKELNEAGSEQSHEVGGVSRRRAHCPKYSNSYALPTSMSCGLRIRSHSELID